MKPFRLSYSGPVIVSGNEILENRNTLKGSWLNTKTDEDVISVNYELQVQRPLNSIQEAYLITPAFWGHLDVNFEGHPLLSYENSTMSSAPANIFSYRVYKVGTLSDKKYFNIQFHGRGLREHSGFRDGNLYIVGPSQLILIKIANFFLNDIHVLYLGICIFLALLSFFASLRRTDHRRMYRFLCVANIAILPYHILATNLWSNLLDTYSLPFAVNIVAQCIALPCFMGFAAQLSLPDTNISKVIRMRYALFMAVIVSTMLAVAFVEFTYHEFRILANIFFLGILGTFIFLMIEVNRTGGRSSLMLLAGSLCLSNLYADLTFSSLYLLGHGIFIFTMIGFITFMDQNIAMQAFTKGFAPSSVTSRAFEGIRKGLSLADIRKNMRDNRTITAVSIDICRYTALMETYGPDISHSVARKAFLFAKRSFENHRLELLKEIGDNISMVGGLQNSKTSKQQLARDTIKAISELLHNVAHLYQELEKENLPRVEFKISASIGDHVCALNALDDRHQFDITGEGMIVIKRIEDGMTGEFHEEYGTNLALISVELWQACDDPNIRSLFTERVFIKGKHGKVYECYLKHSLEKSGDENAFEGSFDNVS